MAMLINTSNDDVYLKMPLGEIVKVAVHIFLSYPYSMDRFQLVVVAASRIQEEVTTGVALEDRPEYERLLTFMDLSLSMLPWKQKVETFV
jgi:hypothetical protein